LQPGPARRIGIASIYPSDSIEARQGYSRLWRGRGRSDWPRIIGTGIVGPIASWFAFTPMWALALIIFLGMAGAAAIGYALRRRHQRTDGSGKDGDSQEGLMVSAVMGLLALLIGFTFSLAIERFDTRRDRVLVEANAIGTTYLRTQLLDEPHRARISKMLVDYTDNRIALSAADGGTAQQRALLSTNDRMLTDLWTATVAAFPSMRGYDFSSAYLDSMNNLIDMDASRKAGRLARVPAEVLIVLILFQFIAVAVMAYVLSGRRGRQAAALLFLLFGIALLLVVDIDRPTDGGIRVSQQAMLDLQKSLKAQPPAIFDRLNGRTAP
jgi:hypothetical protein